jgi:hypothetical protein
LIEAIHQNLPAPDHWPPLNTYPDSLAEAIIDALWSERVRYQVVQEIVERYRVYRIDQGGDPDRDSARELLASFGIGLEEWIARIGNRQRAYSRTKAPLKAELVRMGAEACVDVGIVTTHELIDAIADGAPAARDLEDRWLALPSQHSGLTWERLRLVSGDPNVPVDVWVRQFVDDALAPDGEGLLGAGEGRGAGEGEATAELNALIDRVAGDLGTTPFRLRNAIWKYQTVYDRAHGHGPKGAHRIRPGAPANE